MPSRDGRAAPVAWRRPPVPARLEDTPVYLAGLAERLFADTLTPLRALQRMDPLLARDVAGRWADTLDALAQR